MSGSEYNFCIRSCKVNWNDFLNENKLRFAVTNANVHTYLNGTANYFNLR